MTEPASSPFSAAKGSLAALKKIFREFDPIKSPENYKQAAKDFCQRNPLPQCMTCSNPEMGSANCTVRAPSASLVTEDLACEACHRAGENVCSWKYDLVVFIAQDKYPGCDPSYIAAKYKQFRDAEAIKGGTGPSRTRGKNRGARNEQYPAHNPRKAESISQPDSLSPVVAQHDSVTKLNLITDSTGLKDFQIETLLARIAVLEQKVAHLIASLDKALKEIGPQREEINTLQKEIKSLQEEIRSKKHQAPQESDE